MKYSFTAAALLAASSGALAQNGCANPTFEEGNYYCSEVTQLQYQNFASSGSYNQVTNMDTTTGQCSTQPFAYSGSLAPLDGEVSVHIRGPTQLTQFAVLLPGSNSNKKRSEINRRHGHGHAHFHQHDKEIRAIQDQAEKRGVGDPVTVTMNGKLVSWINSYSGAPAAPTVQAAQPVANDVSNAAAAAAPAPTQSQAQSQSSSSSTQPTYSGDWVQTAYYNAANSTATGLTFLNHLGGKGSGTWTSFWGNSLSYASSDGTDGASSPQVLADAVIPGGQEIVIMTDKSCDDGSCVSTYPGSVNNHGFNGANKIFFFEFSMPHSSSSVDGANVDMPAIWLLNAELARTLQYANTQSPECCCWQSGCGEFDLFEVLSTNSEKAKSTLHGNGIFNGGSSDYFARPSSGAIKLAVVMTSSQATIKVLDDSYSIPTSMSDSDVTSLIGQSNALNNLVSQFNLG